MSPWLFTSAIIEERPIDVFNYGKMQRDFTYIEDIAEGTVKVLDKISVADQNFDSNDPDPSRSHCPFMVYNIGNSEPVNLMEFINIIEKKLGKVAQKKFLPMQNGDVIATYADVSDLKQDCNFEPKTSLDMGIAKWIEWYKDYST